jgi:hypothetical protein
VIQWYRVLDEFPTEDYCDAYWVKYSNIVSARIAKRKLDNHSFYGKALHLCYAPECEDVSDVRDKLQQRKKCIAEMTQAKDTHVPTDILTPTTHMMSSFRPTTKERRRI